jgi:predicted ferric reductase
LCERLYRLYKSQTRKLQVLKIVKLPDSSPVMEVQFSKVHTEAGQVCCNAVCLSFHALQYVFINCSDVSQLEWHPITLTSSPELDYCSVHIRIVGDWTSTTTLWGILLT